ncbi:MAG: polysaccharide biosynthesis C-terminal domain-containing protein [Bacteroidota bacterium]
MGIVQRDSIRITIISYIGAAIGYFNKILLFPNFLSTEQVGLANILINISVVYAQFSALGMPWVTLRFFPYFNDKHKQHHGFLFWILFVSLLGFLIVTLLFFTFQSTIISYYTDNSPLLVEYILYIIPMGLATMLYGLFDVYLRSLMKSVVPSFINEIVLRLFITISISLYALKLVTFHEFVIIYVAFNCSISVILLLYMAFLKQLLITPQWSLLIKRLFRILLNFGFFAILSNMSYILMTNIDSIMVASMLGLKETGIYTTIFFISAIMLIPYRSLARVASPIVAQYWKSRQMHKMFDLYKKVTLMNIISGCFLFLVLWVNIDNLFSFIPKEYALGKYVFLFLGLGRLFDMITGVNGIILVTSKKYRYDLLFALLLIVLMITMNLFFIPRYGITGASIGTMITLIIYNSLRIFYILKVFKMQPFDVKSILVLAISGITFVILYCIPFLFNVYIDIIIRSSVCLMLYMIPIYFLKISSEVNEYIQNILKTVRLYLLKRKN